jgi:gamma-glutamylcyclotransferase (GGCT)/AIG2-like uncharacterized protein YtfP
MKDDCQHLFVYGSLRQGFHSPAYHYISRYFNLVSMGKVKGTLYDLGPYPAAIPGDEATHFIIGELYALKKPAELEWALAQLDDYEGLNADEGETPLYRRDKVTVFTENGETDAWVYWYNQPIENKPVVSSGDILQYLASKK